MDPIVIDTGSFETKAGFAGHDAPSVVFETLIGRPRLRPGQVIESSKCTEFVGPDAQNKKGILQMSCPIEKGTITNWDDLCRIWNCVFYEMLSVNPTDASVIIADALIDAQTKQRKKIAETLFETQSIGLLCIRLQPFLSFLNYGFNCGCAVEIGEQLAQITPIHNGRVIREASQSVPLAGGAITNFLLELINREDDILNKAVSKSYAPVVAREMKRKYAYIAPDYEIELEKSVTSSSLTTEHELPDGSMFPIGDERFRAPELLFRPDFSGLDDKFALHNAIYDSMMKCDESLRGEIFSRITLSGGTALLPGLGPRLEAEFLKLAPAEAYRSVKISVPETAHSAWVGGSMLGCSSQFENACITRAQFEESGPDAYEQRWGGEN